MMRAKTLIVALFFLGCQTPTKPAPEAKKEVAKKAQAKEKKAAKAEPEPEPGNPALLDPALAKEEAPKKYKVKFDTTIGEFVVEVTRKWAPLGADRFYNLVKIGFYDDVAFFRVIDGFMVQFGIHGDPRVNRAWATAGIKDDPVKQSNKPGYVTFATAGPDSRTTQVFVNYGNNKPLDKMGFSPFGKVVEGMDVVKKIHSGYGEGAPKGRGPNQGKTKTKGNKYLKKDFPKLDYVKTATIVEG
jgi:peptidyl-prolyl cis-trans isomerase A (cyclophilin A)